ncbi:hypothetical protein [Caminibacter sp.]
MKKLVFVLIVFTGLFAQDDKYLMYVNKLVNYNFELKDVQSRAPFEIKIIKNKKTIEKILVKRVKVDLLSIFGNKARIRERVYLGDQLIKSKIKWVKVGDKIYNCKVVKITFTNLVLKCNKRILIKSINEKIPFIKEKK